MPGVRRYLKQNVGRRIVVQCWGFSARGVLQAEKGDGLVIVDAEMFDEGARQPIWQAMDGELLIPAPCVRFVQVL